MENNSNMLAKLSLGINVLLIIAVIFLFVKMPGNESTETASDNDTTQTTVMPEDDGKLNIAFFNADSLNNNLLVMKDIEAELTKAQADAQARIQRKEKELQSWQDKWAKKGKLLPNEQQQYMQEAQTKEQEYAMLQQDVQMNLAREQEEYMLSLISRVSDASKTYAEENGFDYVMSYQLGQNIYYASPNFDITESLIQMMNDDYSGENAGEETNEEEAGE